MSIVLVARMTPLPRLRRGGFVDNPVIGVSIVSGELVVTFADGTTETHDLPAGVVVGVGTGTADLLVERLGTLDNPTLPDDRRWLGTGVVIPDGVHVLMIDAGQASDDYHLVDWDAITGHVAVVAGAVSMAGEFETFKGDAFTDLRIGHTVTNEVLIANDSTNPLSLLHIHFERLLAPLGAGGNGVDQDARDAAAAAQSTADAARSTADGKIDTAAANALIAAHTADATAHHNPPVGGGGNVFDGAKLPGSPVAMRLGWSQTQVTNEAIFTRANDHPIDGAAVGMSDGLAFPPFPPALNADRTLYIHLWVEGSPDIVLLAVALGGLRLDHFASHGALTVGGVAGALYISNSRLRQPGTTNSVSLVIVGDVIASQPWVTEQIAAIPEPTGGATVSRFTATFVPSTYTFTSEASGGGTGGFATLTTPYPAGLTRDTAVAGFKTAYVRGDSQETPTPEWKMLVEFTANVMYSSGQPGVVANDAFQLTFATSAIMLTLHGRELAQANQRDGWFLNLSMVS